jgi:ribosome-binding factor A
MTDPARARKIADRIQQIVAEMLERRIKDPRLGFVTVTEARLTGDLRDATVFYTVYGSDTERAATAAALDSAKGVIRTEVGRKTGLRHTPTLTFVPDAVPDQARHLDDLLARARAADEEVARRAEGARPAGDPNPYREPATDADTDSDADSEADPGSEPGPGGPAAGPDTSAATPPGTASDLRGGGLPRDVAETRGGGGDDTGYSAS